MKTICWNNGLIIRAETEQDSYYLHNYIERLEHKDVLDGFMEIMVGKFGSDGKLESEGNFLLSEFDEANRKNGGAIFYETDFQEHSGENGMVVEITLLGFFDYGDKEFKKILEQKITKL